MPTAEKRTVSLSASHSSYIDALVEDGRYASASEVVRAGLKALQEREAAIERWLRDEVAPAHDRIEADPSRAIPADTVAQSLRAHHDKRQRPAD